MAEGEGGLYLVSISCTYHLTLFATEGVSVCYMFCLHKLPVAGSICINKRANCALESLLASGLQSIYFRFQLDQHTVASPIQTAAVLFLVVAGGTIYI